MGKYRRIDQDQCMTEVAFRQRLAEKWETIWSEPVVGFLFCPYLGLEPAMG